MEYIEDQDRVNDHEGSKYTIDGVTYIMHKTPMHDFWKVSVTSKSAKVPPYLDGLYTTPTELKRRIEQYKNNINLRVAEKNARLEAEGKIKPAKKKEAVTDGEK